MALILLAPTGAYAGDNGNHFLDQDKAQHHHFAYEVYAGGLNAFEAEVEFRQTPKRYHIELDARIKGFLGSMIPWQGRYTTKGWRTDAHSYKPYIHTTSTTWRGETETRSYRYARSGGFQSLTVKDDGEAARTKEVDNGLADNAVDILSATLNVTKAMANETKCQHTATAFDGKRRFKLHFRHKNMVDMKANSYNSYNGRAARCIIELVPQGGKWHDEPRGWLLVQEQGRKYGQLPTAWMARLSDKSPAMPVRLEVKTYYGSVVMHLVEYQKRDINNQQQNRD